MNKKNNQLKRKLLILPITIMVLGSILTIGLQHIAQKELFSVYQAERYKLLKSGLKQTQSNLVTWQKAHKDEALFWANNKQIKLYFKKLSALKSQEELIHSKSQEALRTLMGSLINNKGFNGFFLITQDGTNVGSMRNKNLGKKSLLLNRPKIIEKVLNGQTIITHPMPSDVSLSKDKLAHQTATMFVLSPVYMDNRISGIFGIRMSPSKEFSTIFQSGRTGLSGETYAFNKEGLMLSESRFTDDLIQYKILSEGESSILNVSIKNPISNLRLGESHALKIQDQNYTLMAQSALSKGAGSNLNGYNDYRGVPVIGVWEWDKDMDFGYTFEIDLDEAYGPYNIAKKYNDYAAIFMILLLLILSLILYFSRKKSYKQNIIIAQALDAEKAALEAKGNFLANMSHEIRTPLNGIIGAVDLFKRKSLDEKQTSLLNIVDSTSQSLLGIVNEILDFSKIDAGMLTIDNKIFDIQKSVKDIIHIFQTTASQKGLLLTYNFSKDLPQYIIGDEGRIKQVSTNLINNAIKFTSKGSVQVNLEYDINSHKLEIRVIDTGIGIPNNQIKNLFKPFTQADSSSIRKAGGTGLGLAITEQLSKLMGGSLTVLTELEKGSTFTATLITQPPSTEEIQKHKKASQEQEKSSNYKYNGSILVAEDNITNQTLVKAMLEKLSCKVSIANNGLECFEMSQSANYDFIFMDCQMPLMDGYEATQKIRSKGIDIPIIALTAHAFKENKEKCLEVGMNDHMIKPFNFDGLCQMIKKWDKKNFED